jgi:hypothetical protein
MKSQFSTRRDSAHSLYAAKAGQNGVEVAAKEESVNGPAKEAAKPAKKKGGS